jgi:hypothetical protein
MLILFRLFVFIYGLSFDAQDTNETLMGAHKNLLVRARVVHESDGLGGDLSCCIEVG